jgi:hypothetical protein
MFVSSAVDEADLTLAQFRVLAHICRRAGAGECWASSPAIAKSCRINLKTARKAIADLAKMGWITAQKRTGMTTKYTPRTLPNSIPYPIQYPTQSDTPHPTQSDTPHPTQSDTPEGNPLRKPKKVTQIKVDHAFQSDEFRDAWQAWQTHRREIKKPMTETSAGMLMKKLGKMGESNAIAAIEQSIASGWQGVFEPKTSNNQNQSQKSLSERTAEMVAQQKAAGTWQEPGF